MDISVIDSLSLLARGGLARDTRADDAGVVVDLLEDYVKCLDSTHRGNCAGGLQAAAVALCIKY